MQNPTTTQPATPNEPQDERAEWVTPTITDYDVEEATLGPTTNAAHKFDGISGYS